MPFPLLPIILGELVRAGLRKALETPRRKEEPMEIWLGLIRHLLTAGGGMLAAKGYGDSSTWEAIAGGVVTVVGALWSVWDKRTR